MSCSSTGTSFAAGDTTITPSAPYIILNNHYFGLQHECRDNLTLLRPHFYFSLHNYTEIVAIIHLRTRRIFPYS